MYKDFYVKTAWDQRGGEFQFSPIKERVLCGNLADATIVFYNGWQYQGSKSYATDKGVFYCDFDGESPNYNNIPRLFLNSFSDEKMYDLDLLLWQQCLTGEMEWDNSTVDPTYGYITLLREHIPANIFTYRLKQKDSETGAEYKTKEELEEIIKANIDNPFMAFAQQLGGGSNHGWVVDGLREKNGKLQIHCNFGWAGRDDGWYNLWDPIVNSMIDYQDPYRRFRFFVPFTAQEKANYKPFVLTQSQKQAIKAETHKIPYIENKTLYLPEGTTVAPKNSYKGNTTITSVKLPSTIRKLNISCFQGCTGLKEVTIPQSVEYIANSAFHGCKNITTVYFNATNCTYGGDLSTPAFGDCTNIARVVVADGVKTIPANLFRNCTGLKEIEIPASVTSIGSNSIPKTAKIKCPKNSYTDSWAHQNAYVTTSDFSVTDAGALTISEGVKTIPTEAYANNTSLTAITFASTVEIVDQRAFKNCSNVQTVYYNATKASISGENANAPFAGCTGVTKVIVKEGVVKVPPTIFLQCTALQTIQIPATVTEIGRTPFPKTTKIICPAGSFADTWARKNGYTVSNN